MRDHENYESHGLLQYQVRRQLSSYLQLKLGEHLVEHNGLIDVYAVEPGLLLSGEASVSRVDDSQFSTHVDEDDPRFGYGLALSPLQDWEDKFGVSAMYLKIDRENRCFAEEPLCLKLGHSASSEALRTNRPTEADDWTSILGLLRIAQVRRSSPELYPIDSRTMYVITKESEGVLPYLANNFGDRDPAVSRRERVEASLSHIFEDSQYMPDGESVAIRSASPTADPLSMIVERKDTDYVISLIGQNDSLSCKRFTIGPYGEDEIELGGLHGLLGAFDDSDLEVVEALLSDGVQMSLLELGDARLRIDEIYETIS